MDLRHPAGCHMKGGTYGLDAVADAVLEDGRVADGDPFEFDAVGQRLLALERRGAGHARHFDRLRV